MVSTYNSEGYKDPVVYEALTRVEAEERAARAAAAYRPLVYICSPYAGDIEKNTYRARAFSRFAVEKKNIPIAPHLLCPQYLNEETERWLGLKMGIEPSICRPIRFSTGVPVRALPTIICGWVDIN